jgi:hypothetical protein
MPFQISPGINVREIDLTTIVPAVATSEGAIAGLFRWGPIDERTLIDTENSLAQRFGTPSNHNAETWFTAASFLGYGNRLFVVRAADTTGNTVTKTSASSAVEAGNNEISITTGVTNLSEGMVVVYANASVGIVGAKITSIDAGANTITISSSPTVNASAIEIVFRENIPYTAIAQEGTAEYSIDWDGYIVKNEADYEQKDALGEVGSASTDSVRYVARYAGDIGNSLRISVCDSAAQFSSNTDLSPNAQINATASVITANVGSNTLSVTVRPANTANSTEVTSAQTVANNVAESLAVGDLIEIGNTRIGFQALKVTGVGTVTGTSNVFSFTVNVEDEYKLAANVSVGYVSRYWEFFNSVDAAPAQSDYVRSFGNTAANDEVHVVVVDEGGKITGSPGTILEVYRNLSRATDAKSSDGATIYYKNVINDQSNYIWWTSDRDSARSNTAQFVTSSSEANILNTTFFGGADGLDEANVPFSTLALAYDKFVSSEDVDISLVLQGKARGTVASNYAQLGNYIIDNICEVRKDCVAFISPDRADVVTNAGLEASAIVEFRNSLRSTSYGILDSGYKYMYDKYNDVYRYVPLNGDIAGLCARTDNTNDPWWSPAGINRGQIKNIIKLAYNPRKADRDTLYKEGCNPVVTFPGQGTILFGDKTLLARPSAFDRINVRRLFIVLEKAISIASKGTLFEFNDAFTRSQFRNLIIPYLRDVQGRRGITDFLVVCDESNNTPEVIDRNEFIGDIYIKPARSINFIQLNFVAVRTGVAFSEVVGQF